MLIVGRKEPLYVHSRAMSRCIDIYVTWSVTSRLTYRLMKLLIVINMSIFVSLIVESSGARYDNSGTIGASLCTQPGDVTLYRHMRDIGCHAKADI
jgi:hypothetical protein